MKHQAQSLYSRQELVTLSILHGKGLFAKIKLHVHTPHMTQQVALVLGRLLTSYTTLYYTNYMG
jgi:hypothetical protein